MISNAFMKGIADLALEFMQKEFKAKGIGHTVLLGETEGDKVRVTYKPTDVGLTAFGQSFDLTRLLDRGKEEFQTEIDKMAKELVKGCIAACESPTIQFLWIANLENGVLSGVGVDEEGPHKACVRAIAAHDIHTCGYLFQLGCMVRPKEEKRIE